MYTRSEEGGSGISHVEAEDPSPGTDLIRDTTLRSAGGVHNTSSLNASLGYADNVGQEEETHSENVGSDADELPSKAGFSHGWYPGLISKICMYVILLATFMVLIGPTCASQGKGPPDFSYTPYRQTEVARNTVEVIASIPGEGFVMNMTWIPISTHLGPIDCSMVVQSNNCTISTVNGRKNSCNYTLPFITVKGNDTGHQSVMATVKEDAQYCLSVSAINHHQISQGGFLVVPRPAEDPSRSGVNWKAFSIAVSIICGILLLALLYVYCKKMECQPLSRNQGAC